MLHLAPSDGIEVTLDPTLGDEGVAMMTSSFHVYFGDVARARTRRIATMLARSLAPHAATSLLAASALLREAGADVSANDIVEAASHAVVHQAFIADGFPHEATLPLVKRVATSLLRLAALEHPLAVAV